MPKETETVKEKSKKRNHKKYNEGLEPTEHKSKHKKSKRKHQTKTVEDCSVEEEKMNYGMENELESQHPKKRQRLGQMSMKSETETSFETTEGKVSEEEVETTRHKSKHVRIDKEALSEIPEDHIMIPSELPGIQLKPEELNKLITEQALRIGQFESHVAVLTNSVAELQRSQSKVLKQQKTIKKQLDAVRHAWAGQLNVKNTLIKQKKNMSNAKKNTKQKKAENTLTKQKKNISNAKKNTNQKKGKCKKDKKEKNKDSLTVDDTMVLSNSCPLAVDSNKSSSKLSPQKTNTPSSRLDLSKRLQTVHTVLTNLLSEMHENK